MPKKTLTGSTKLTQAVPTVSSTEQDAEGLRLVRKKPKTMLKNFRLTASDVQRLHKITAAINEESERIISETTVIRGLIALGEKTSPARLIKAIREIL